MNKLRRTGAIVTLSLTIVVSAFAGTIHGPGTTTPPPPTGQTTSTTSISTEIILTILGLIR
ncbi:MAG TPA: hypothetical protein VGN10_04875 [Pyrinomonadaceae bacterium]|jgi:hypothetical protein